MEAKIIEVDAERRRLSLSLKRVEGGGVTQRADDSEPVEGTPNLELSEEVFPERAEPVAEAEAPAETADEEAPAEPAEQEAPVEPAEEEPPAEELLDDSIEADAVASDEPGPGDSEGEPPAAPE